METSDRLQILLEKAVDAARKWRHEYVTPEHLLYVLTMDEIFKESFSRCDGNYEKLRKDLKNYFKQNYEQVPEQITYTMVLSKGFQAMLERAALQADSSGRSRLQLPHVFYAMMQLPECYAVYLIAKQKVDINDVFFQLCQLDEEEEEEYTEDKYESMLQEEWGEPEPDSVQMQDWEESEGHKKADKNWRQYVTCLNDLVEQPEYTPLVGREEEIARTILILCRKTKNNPLHIGEPGVGKTAITYGLTRRIVEGRVPDALKNATVYAVDMGNMVAGTQYRGDFEKRMKQVLDGIAKEEQPIVYLDEIHNVIGAGAVNGGALDASNILKPYLTQGKIRFIGATTYDEYKKHFEQSRSMVRRFQNVDIKEPTVEETIKILEGIKKYYEDFHGVIYPKEMIKLCVTLSDKYIRERFLPDKAIDLLDETGALLNMRLSGQTDDTKVKKEQKKRKKEKQMSHVVTKELLEEVISRFCNIPAETIVQEEITQLKTLDDRLKSFVYGQDEAVQQICSSIKLSRAGLNEENKPVASFLFVGPTGVGKTEIARTLAKELGVELVRFDMSEYMEKNAVAKFIGAPAGYVGYEEGGMLTDAIRKTPHCVLLLDEIEKAHSDIYNVLLQVMDYATLSDNQGRKADFRNVIIIMTSNAGADQLGKPALGFSGQSGQTINENAIQEAVKHTFTPEFRNRLSKVVAFSPMNREMAEKIVAKQCRILATRLEAKKITVTFTKALKKYILETGISVEYGAREMQRVMDQKIKPVLVEAMLFGELAKGGKCQLDYNKENGGVVMQVEKAKTEHE